MAIGDALLGAPTDLPVIPVAAPAPGIPAPTPAELVAQLQGYQNAFAGMQGGTALPQALTRFGFDLLQPIRPGDSPGGVLARAATGAMDYYNARQAAERNQMFQGLEAGLKTQEAGTRAAATAESIAASRQQRGITEARAPTDLGLLQQQYQKAKADLDLIRQEEAAGVRTPEFLKRKADAEVAVRESLAKMYDAHTKLYSRTADTVQEKNKRQTLNVKTVENADGTTSLVSTIVVNGEPYQQVFTPARFTDIRAATEFARKQVDKETPGAWNPFAGKAPYQGTAEEEVARRAKQYMEPTLITVNPQGRQITPEEFQRVGAEQLSGPPPASSPATSTTPADWQARRETPAQAQQAAARSVEIIKSELADARKNGTPAAVAALEKELVNAAKAEKTGGYQTPAAKGSSPVTAAGPTKFERDANGNIVPVATPGTVQKGASSPTSAPVAPPVDPVQAQFEQARASLARARATLMSYGARQQREDPQGYRNALAMVSRLQSEMAQYLSDPAMEARIAQEGQDISEGRRTTVSPEVSAYSSRKTTAKADEDIAAEQRRQLERSRSLR